MLYNVTKCSSGHCYRVITCNEHYTRLTLCNPTTVVVQLLCVVFTLLPLPFYRIKLKHTKGQQKRIAVRYAKQPPNALMGRLIFLAFKRTYITGVAFSLWILDNQ